MKELVKCIEFSILEILPKNFRTFHRKLEIATLWIIWFTKPIFWQIVLNGPIEQKARTQDIVRLFHCVWSLVSWKFSTRYDYSILYLYSVLKSKLYNQPLNLMINFSTLIDIWPHDSWHAKGQVYYEDSLI